MTRTRYILAGNFIDGSGADVRKNVFLEVKDTTIAAIGPAKELPPIARDQTEDLSHCTIVPALVDCSVFLSRSPAVNTEAEASNKELDPARKKDLLEQHIHYCHTHGVLGIADCEDQAELLTGDQKKSIEIKTPDHDFLRIEYSPPIEETETRNTLIPREKLHQLLHNKGNKKAVVVASGPQEIAEALAAGCDAIEQGYGMTEDNLRSMAEKNVLWIPSVLRAKNMLDSAGAGEIIGCRFSTRYVAPGKSVPGAEAIWKKVLTDQLSQLRLARELGVKTAIGTGAGSVGILHGESMVEEMKLFLKAGYSLLETFHCASENGAAFFNMENLGALAVGRKATFLLTRGTVQQLPRKLSYLEGIYVNGAPSKQYRKNPVKK